MVPSLSHFPTAGLLGTLRGSGKLSCSSTLLNYLLLTNDVSVTQNRARPVDHKLYTRYVCNALPVESEAMDRVQATAEEHSICRGIWLCRTKPYPQSLHLPGHHFPPRAKSSCTDARSSQLIWSAPSLATDPATTSTTLPRFTLALTTAWSKWDVSLPGSTHSRSSSTTPSPSAKRFMLPCGRLCPPGWLMRWDALIQSYGIRPWDGPKLPHFPMGQAKTTPRLVSRLIRRRVYC